ncbi:MAG TPA: FHA domain-containing protein [Gemmatimonadaceae bacterium]|jgi:FOG: FHA domain
MPFLELEGTPELTDNPRELVEALDVGSGSQVDWRIQRRDLAARHFRLELGGVMATVRPASNQNVVALNGQQVPTGGADIHPGDVIAAGSARFVYLETRDTERPARPDEPPPALLVDPATRKAFTMRNRVVQIGREIGCSIVLKDPTVSRFHADVRSEAGGYVLYSMGSAGTKINGQTVTAPRMLVEGDEIAIGGTTFTFMRGAIPPGMSRVQFEDHAEDAVNRRQTVVAQRAITAAHGPAARRQRGWAMPLVLGAGLVAMLAALYVVFVR